MIGLRPFWRYYGAKWRIAPRYPKPRHRTIIEPFAGAAGYSLRYPDHDVIIVDKYHVISEIWRWLISVSVDEVMALPVDVSDVNDLPSWAPKGAIWLVGFAMSAASSTPKRTLSPERRAKRLMQGQREGFTAAVRDRIAAQVPAIRHWRVIEGDYTAAPHAEATWLIDPPYRGRPGSRYTHHSGSIDYPALARWCRARRGQTIVCEAASADWLPFVPFGSVRGMSGAASREAIWWQDTARSQGDLDLGLLR